MIMKKLVLILLAFFVFLFSNAQNKRFGTKITFDKGTLVSNIGVGIISPYWVTGTNIALPPICASLEYGITSRIGLGLLVGYSASFEPKTAGYDYINSYSYITAQLRGAYHFIHRDNLDLYVGLGIGYTYGSRSTNYFDNIVADKSGKFDPYSGKPGGIAPTVFFGGRYYFSKQIGVFGEVGYAISYISAGLVVRFQ